MRKPYQIILPILLGLFCSSGRQQPSLSGCNVRPAPSPTRRPSRMLIRNQPYIGPTTQALNGQGFLAPTANVNGAIKCQQISGGDGFATMADGHKTFMFSFGPLSGLCDIAAGLPGTQFPSIFNTTYPGTLLPGDPATTGAGFTYNGAVGLAPDLGCRRRPSLDNVDPRQIMDVGVMNGNIPAPLMAFDEETNSSSPLPTLA